MNASFIKIITIFCNPYFIIPAIIIGFFLINHKIFYDLACLTFISIIFNVALKVSFKKPIPKAKAFGPDPLAFPSGHTQTPVVFYGYLAYVSKNIILQILSIILLLAIFKVILYEEYHDLEDVFGGIFFAILSVFIYNLLLYFLPKYKKYLPFILSTLMMAYIQLIYSRIPQHCWLAYYSLLGLVFANNIFKYQQYSLTIRVISTIICLIIFAKIYPELFSKSTKHLPEYIRKLPAIIIGAIIPSANYFVSFFIKRSGIFNNITLL